MPRTPSRTLRRPLTRAATAAPVASTSVRSADSVPLLRRVPSGRTVALALGVARTAAGAGLAAAPVQSARVLGHDTATATRAAWLVQAMGARDVALGLGTLRSAGRRGAGLWLLAGAVADLGDAAALDTALRQGRLRGPVARAVSVVAAASAAAAVWAALDRRGR